MSVTIEYVEPVLDEVVITSYEGDFDEERGTYDGDGVAHLDNDCKYEGSFKLGMFHGKGKFTWSNGNAFEGDFICGTMKGKGKYTWYDGSTYEGDILDGFRHGQGKFNASSGQCYDGQWLDGQRHGHGRMYYNSDKTVTYLGDWVRNQRHGYGIMKYASGNIYEGEWKKDKKCGSGVLIWRDVDEVYTGQWDNDLPHGLGEHIWGESGTKGVKKEVCNMYRGQFVAGKRHGQGTFFYMNGSQYTGAWEEDEKQGEGIFVYADGKIYAGRFEANRMKHPAGSNEASAPRATEAVNPQYHLNISDVFDRLPTLLDSTRSQVSSASAAAAAAASGSSSGLSPTVTSFQKTLPPLGSPLSKTTSVPLPPAIMALTVRPDDPSVLGDIERNTLKQKQQVQEMERILLKYNHYLRTLIKRYSDLATRKRLRDALILHQTLNNWQPTTIPARAHRAAAIARSFVKRFFCMNLDMMLRLLRECGIVGPYFNSYDLSAILRAMRNEARSVAITKLKDSRMHFRKEQAEQDAAEAYDLQQELLKQAERDAAESAAALAAEDASSSATTAHRSGRGVGSPPGSSGRPRSPTSPQTNSPPVSAKLSGRPNSRGALKSGSAPSSPGREIISSGRAPSSGGAATSSARDRQHTQRNKSGRARGSSSKREGVWPMASFSSDEREGAISAVITAAEDYEESPEEAAALNKLNITPLWDCFLQPAAQDPDFDLLGTQPLREREVVELLVRAIAVWYARCQGCPVLAASAATTAVSESSNQLSRAGSGSGKHRGKKSGVGGGSTEDVAGDAAGGGREVDDEASGKDPRVTAVRQYGAPGMSLKEILYHSLAEKILPLASYGEERVPEFYLDFYHEEVQALLVGLSEEENQQSSSTTDGVDRHTPPTTTTTAQASVPLVAAKTVFERIWQKLLKTANSDPANAHLNDDINLLPAMHAAGLPTNPQDPVSSAAAIDPTSGNVQLRHFLMYVMQRKGSWITADATLTSVLQATQFAPLLYSKKSQAPPPLAAGAVGAVAPDSATSAREGEAVGDTPASSGGTAAAPSAALAAVTPAADAPSAPSGTDADAPQGAEKTEEQKIVKGPAKAAGYKSGVDMSCVARRIDFHDFLELLCRLVLSPLWCFAEVDTSSNAVEEGTAGEADTGDGEAGTGSTDAAAAAADAATPSAETKGGDDADAAASGTCAGDDASMGAGHSAGSNDSGALLGWEILVDRLSMFTRRCEV